MSDDLKAPRYRLVGYDIGTAPDENGGWVHWTDHEAIVARLTAERAAALAKAFCAGRDAALQEVKDLRSVPSMLDDERATAFDDCCELLAYYIPALTPPADLAAMIGGE